MTSFNLQKILRWEEYTEELYKKDLHDQDNHNGMITQLEPDILECEVKWVLDSITDLMDMGLDGLQMLVMDGGPGMLRFMGLQRVRHD